MINLALCGAHRTGKTTLAQKVAEEMGMKFIPSRVSAIFKEHNLNYNEPMTFRQRMDVQEQILFEHGRDIKLNGLHPWISDRSSLDFAVYALMDTNPTTPDEEQEVINYVNRCLMYANNHYGHILLIQPGIAYVEEEGKPRASIITQEKMNIILLGFLSTSDLKTKGSLLPRANMNLDTRILAVQNLNKRLMEGMLHDRPDNYVLH